MQSLNVGRTVLTLTVNARCRFDTLNGLLASVRYTCAVLESSHALPAACTLSTDEDSRVPGQRNSAQVRSRHAPRFSLLQCRPGGGCRQKARGCGLGGESA